MQQLRRSIKLYFPGLISLLLLPVFLFYFFSDRQKSKDIYGLPVVFPDTVEHYLAKRDFTQIIISEDLKVNEANLNHARILIEKMLDQKDSLTGVKFTFLPSALYRSYIKALEVCHLSKQYIPYENDIFIFYKPPRQIPPGPTIPLFQCGTRDYIKESSLPYYSKARFNDQILSSWQMIVGFVVLLGFSIRRIYLE